MPAFSLLLVDTNREFSKAARRYLARRKEIKAVEIAGSIQEALEMAEMLKPDLVLIELQIVESLDPTLCRSLKAAAPGTIIVGLTLFCSGLHHPGPWSRGVDGIISKEHFAESLLQFVRSINTEELPFIP